MAKLVLALDDDFYDFILIGLACHAKDYRLCYELNKNLDLDLTRTKDDYMVKKGNESDFFSFYEYIDDENMLEYYLISNRGKNGFLLKEYKNIDYLLMIKGSVEFIDVDDIIMKTNAVNNVLTAFEIPTENLKSKQYLIF